MYYIIAVTGCMAVSHSTQIPEYEIHESSEARERQKLPVSIVKITGLQ